MKRNVLVAALALAAGSLLAADPKDAVTAAAKKLADGGNFSWKQTVDDAAAAGGGGGFTMGPTSGKAANGFVYQSISFNDNAIETVTKGTNGARKGGFGGFGGGGGGGDQAATWQTFEEAAAAAAANGGGGPGGGFGGGGRRGGRGGGAAIALPTDAIPGLLADMKEVKMDGDVYSGDLKDDTAKSRAGTRGGFGGGGGLAAGAGGSNAPAGGGRGGFGGGGGGFGGGGGGFTPPEVTGAKGSVKFWVKGGVLAKVELKVTGKTTDFNGDPSDINRTTTVEFTDVGTTKLPVPDDIIKKISK